MATVGTVFLTVAADGHSTRHAERATGWALSAVAVTAAGAALVLARKRTSLTG